MCLRCFRCDRHHAFDSSKSHSYKSAPNGEKLAIEYLSGKIEGQLGQDTVRLGELAVKDQFFGAAEQIDVPLLDIVEWDGIVGLAYPNKDLERKGIIPIFDQIMKENLVPNDKHFFAYHLGKDGGSLSFGHVDHTKLAPTSDGRKHCESNPIECFEFIPVTNPGFWGIEIVDLFVAYDKGVATPTGICKGKANDRYVLNISCA